MLGALLTAATLTAQTPQPFPRPTAPPPPPPAPAAPKTPASAAQPPAPAPTAAPGIPTEAMLGAPLYPSAVYLTSYDAGRGQRFYLFGVQVPYAEMVNYYKTILKQKGDELYQSPPTHQFETGKFREDVMAFVPSVTVKDYTSGGSAGFPNPQLGATPERFPTILQFVPAPPAGKN
jgi:hypothetical protein